MARARELDVSSSRCQDILAELGETVSDCPERRQGGFITLTDLNKPSAVSAGGCSPPVTGDNISAPVTGKIREM